MGPWNHLEAFEASAMALGIEVDAVLAPMPPFGPWSRLSTGKGQGGELARAWLGCSSHGLVSSMLFGAVLGWNVTFVRKCLSDGLSWVDPDELIGFGV
ncbi:MAG: hypothetical protein [Namikivirus tsukuho]|uniref:Uncharacterized protein n=1 Tax=Bacteriophage sp. TaxID=38018 RepID=A0ABY5TVT1_9VIRU|nr:MAG: hypothetical protein [Bacteriophage sp.]